MLTIPHLIFQYFILVFKDALFNKASFLVISLRAQLSIIKRLLIRTEAYSLHPLHTTL